MRPEEDFSVIMLEERNIVVTDSLILAAAASTTTAATTTMTTKRNFEMSSRPNVGVDSIVDASQTSLYNSEVFPAQSSTEKSSEAEFPIPNHATATPIHFSGLAFKQQNSIFHKVRLNIILV